MYSSDGGARCAAILLWEKTMSAPKRVAWKDIVTPPLNWKAPKIAEQESAAGDDEKDKEEQGPAK